MKSQTVSIYHKCPKCGVQKLIAYKDEVDPYRIYFCRNCKYTCHPPICQCGHCPKPRMKANG